MTVDLAAGTGLYNQAHGDTLSGIEGIIGSSVTDNLYGDANANSLWGQDGGDLLDGRGGNDTLYGGAGADTLDGGAGTDRAIYAGSSAGVTVDLAAGPGGRGDSQVKVEIEYL